MSKHSTSLFKSGSQFDDPEKAQKRNQLDQLGNQMRGHSMEAKVAQLAAGTISAANPDHYSEDAIKSKLPLEFQQGFRAPSFRGGYADLLYFFSSCYRHFAETPMPVKKKYLKGENDFERRHVLLDFFTERWPSLYSHAKDIQMEVRRVVTPGNGKAGAAKGKTNGDDEQWAEWEHDDGWKKRESWKDGYHGKWNSNWKSGHKWNAEDWWNGWKETHWNHSDQEEDWVRDGQQTQEEAEPSSREKVVQSIPERNRKNKNCPLDGHGKGKGKAGRTVKGNGVTSDVQDNGTLDVEECSFGKGESRLAFRAVVRAGEGGPGYLKNYRGFTEGTRLVLKVFREQYRLLELDMSDINYQNRVAVLAKRFTRLLRARVDTSLPRIEVRTAVLGSFSDNLGSHFSSDTKFLLERLIPGKYEKFSSNNGWLSTEDPVLETFSHFTYADVSNPDGSAFVGSPFHAKHKGGSGKPGGGKGKKDAWEPWSNSVEDDVDDRRILVCDLQGLDGAKSYFRLGKRSKEPNFYMLTDPAICSAVQGGEGCYGHTDMGPRGLLSFFVNHKCNEYCHKLGIAECRPQIPENFEACPASRSTSYFSRSASRSTSFAPTESFAQISASSDQVQSAFTRAPAPYSLASLPASVSMLSLRLDQSSVRPVRPVALLPPLSENEEDNEELQQEDEEELLAIGPFDDGAVKEATETWEIEVVRSLGKY